MHSNVLQFPILSDADVTLVTFLTNETFVRQA